MDGVRIAVAGGTGILARSVSAITKRLVRGLARSSLTQPPRLFTADDLREAVATAIAEEHLGREPYPREWE